MFLANFDIIIMGRKKAAIAVSDNTFLHQLSQAERKFNFSPKTVPQNPLIFSNIQRDILREGADVVFFHLGMSLIFYVFEENDHNIYEEAE